MAQKEDPSKGWDERFLRQLEGAAQAVADNKLKVITNAGALNPKALAEACAQMLQKRGLKLKVAYALGDNVTPSLPALTKQGETFEHLEDPKRHLSSWHLEVLTATAYVGARGIVAALRDGADIVIVRVFGRFFRT
jgi:hypothetical protein